MRIKTKSYHWEFHAPKKEKDRVLKILDASLDRETQWDTDMAAVGLDSRKLEAKRKCQERREKRERMAKSLEDNGGKER